MGHAVGLAIVHDDHAYLELSGGDHGMLLTSSIDGNGRPVVRGAEAAMELALGRAMNASERWRRATRAKRESRPRSGEVDLCEVAPAALENEPEPASELRTRAPFDTEGPVFEVSRRAAPSAR
jgi:hypothetical protein